jgi:hypothetical protein
MIMPVRPLLHLLALLTTWSGATMAQQAAQPRETAPPANAAHDPATAARDDSDPLAVAQPAPDALEDSTPPLDREGLAEAPPAADRDASGVAPVPPAGPTRSGSAPPLQRPVATTRAQRLQQQFDLVDGNGDRSLNATELRALGDPALDFHALDRNSDGQISNAEWMARPADSIAAAEPEEE